MLALKRTLRTHLKVVTDERLKTKPRGRRLAWSGVLFAIFGAALFIYFVRAAGVSEIVADVRALGAGFLLVVALAGLRFVARSLAWKNCFDDPRQLPFTEAFRAYLVGDTVGNLMPLGLVVSEPSKAMFVKHRVPLSDSLAALAVENIFYSFSVAVFIFCGVAALLLSFPLNNTLRGASIGILFVVLIVIALAVLVMRRRWRFASGLINKLSKRLDRPSWMTARERVAAIEDRVYGFYETHRRRVLPVLLLEAVFHLAGVAEVFVTLSFISDQQPGVLVAFVLESVNRVINVAFKFVPFRVGVDEAGSGLMSKVLRLGEAAGVSLAIVRKARVLVWVAVGVLFMLQRGFSLKNITREAEQTAKV